MPWSRYMSPTPKDFRRFVFAIKYAHAGDQLRMGEWSGLHLRRLSLGPASSSVTMTTSPELTREALGSGSVADPQMRPRGRSPWVLDNWVGGPLDRDPQNAPSQKKHVTFE
jgi:hypothetical protein